MAYSICCNMNTDIFGFNRNPPILKDFDENLQTFYFRVLEREMDFENPRDVSSIKKSLRDVVNAYKVETLQNAASNISFDTVAKRCAYVFKYSVCFTSVFAHHFLQLLQRNPSILQRALSDRELNICSLGGGPASDAVAVSKIVSAAQEFVFVRNRLPLKLNISIVDINKDWEFTACQVLQTLKKTFNFFAAGKMILNFHFVQADLTQPLSAEVRKLLNKANIVTMVKFLSAVNGSRNRDKIGQMLEEILKLMNAGSCLFYLDSSAYWHSTIIQSALKMNQDFRRIYGPQEKYLHMLSLSSMKTFIKLYAKTFHTLLCLIKCKIFVCAWLKSENVPEPLPLGNKKVKNISTGELSEDESKKGKNYKRKVKSFKLKKLEIFQNKVQQYLSEELCFNFDVDIEFDACGIDILDYEYDKILFPTKIKPQRLVELKTLH